MFDNNEFVCHHMQLTKADILKAIRDKNLTTFEQIQDETDAATICGNCTADIEEILEEELKRQRSEKS